MENLVVVHDSSADSQTPIQHDHIEEHGEDVVLQEIQSELLPDFALLLQLEYTC